jgi:hypothetical protein
MRPTFRLKTFSLAASCLVASLFAAPALAQTPKPQESTEEGIPTNWMTAIRGGAGFGMTQGVVGVLWQSPGMGPNKYLRFRPAVNSAFSSGTFSLGMNLDVVLEAKIPASKFSLIVGGGTSLFMTHTGGEQCVDVPGEGCVGGNEGGSNAFAGSHEMIVGFQHPAGFFVEVRATSGLKHGTEVLAGYFFKGRK